jgi:hypothetical protein
VIDESVIIIQKISQMQLLLITCVIFVVEILFRSFMALKINSTPVLRGKAAKHFLKSVEEDKNNKVSKEEAAKIKAFARLILSKAQV